MNGREKGRSSVVTEEVFVQIKVMHDTVKAARQNAKRGRKSGHSDNAALVPASEDPISPPEVTGAQMEITSQNLSVEESAVDTFTTTPDVRDPQFKTRSRRRIRQGKQLRGDRKAKLAVRQRDESPENDFIENRDWNISRNGSHKYIAQREIRQSEKPIGNIALWAEYGEPGGLMDIFRQYAAAATNDRELPGERVYEASAIDRTGDAVKKVLGVSGDIFVKGGTRIPGQETTDQ